MATYVLTGGATGIGAAIKARLKAAGHRVVVLDLRDADIEVDLSQASQRQAAITALLRDTSREHRGHYYLRRRRLAFSRFEKDPQH